MLISVLAHGLRGTPVKGSYQPQSVDNLQVKNCCPSGWDRSLGMAILCKREVIFQEASPFPGSGGHRPFHSCTRNRLLQTKRLVYGKRNDAGVTCFERLTSDDARASVPGRKWVAHVSRAHNSVWHRAEGLWLIASQCIDFS